MGLLDALTDRRFWSEVGNNVSDLGQSASNAVASNVTAPVDGIAWLLRKAGVQVPEAPIGGSDWAKNAGLLRDVQQSPSSIAGETLGAIAPMLLAAKAPQVARGLLQGADNLMAPTSLRKDAGNVFVYPQDAALATAQRNAALPVSEGGLGLRKNNTPMERANAMGFDKQVFHGTKSDIKEFDVGLAGSKSGHESAEIPAAWVTSHPKVANIFASRYLNDLYPLNRYGQAGSGLKAISTHGMVDGGNVIPLMLRGDPKNTLSAKEAEKMIFGSKNDDWRDSGAEFAKYFTENEGLTKIKGNPMSSLEFRAGQYVVPDPSALRSRFAAFDPMRRNEADLLGRADPELLGLMSAGLLGYGGYNALNKQ